MGIQEELLKSWGLQLKKIYDRSNWIEREDFGYDIFNYGYLCQEVLKFPDVFEQEYDDLEKICCFERKMQARDYKISYEFIAYRDYYLKMSSHVIASYFLTQFPLKEARKFSFEGMNENILSSNETFIKEVSPNEIIDLIMSFLNDFDYELFKKFKQKLDAGEIDFLELGNKLKLGETINFDKLKRNIIIINTNNSASTVEKALTLAHEFGHSVNIDLLNDKNISFNNSISYLEEIPSQFLECSFIRYLLDNDIRIGDAEKLWKGYLYDMFYWNLGIYLQSYFKMSANLMYYQYNMRPLYEKEDNILRQFGFNERLPYDFSNYKIFLYGIGYISSLYLYENYKQDPRYFMKEFKNIFATNPRYTNLDSLERLGVTKEILIKGNTLKKALRDSR